VPAYTEVNARLAWAVTDTLEVSLSGFNLLHPHHTEFTVPPSNEVERSALVETRWKF
jgi:hypothetical protein